MPPRTFRITLRSLHLGLSAVVGTFLYSPWREVPLFEAVTLWIAYPLLALAGIGLWQQARILKLFSPRRPA